MKEVDMILKIVAEGMKAMAQGVETLAGKLDTIAESGVGAKTKTPTKRKKPTPKKATPKKKPITAAETVLKVISRSKKGIGPISIANKTGFPPKKVHNIIYKLKKQGKIKSVGRGLYVKA
jgi:predicted Rossmann fold nucleotide-binding protein DprA/Smf involved in DNA uptake